MSLNPPVLRASMELYRAIMFGESGLSRRERELLATVTSAERAATTERRHTPTTSVRGRHDEIAEHAMHDYRKAELPRP